MSRKTVIRELREGRQALQLELDNQLVCALEGVRKAYKSLSMFTFSKKTIQQKLSERLKGIDKELTLFRLYIKMLMDGMEEKQKQLEVEEEAENGLVCTSNDCNDSGDGNHHGSSENREDPEGTSKDANSVGDDAEGRTKTPRNEQSSPGIIKGNDQNSN